MSVDLTEVGFRYQAVQQPALDGIDLTIAPGEFVVVSGPSGCGKTTVTRLLNGLVPHFHPGELSGQVLVNGREPAGQRVWETAAEVGSVFQNPRTQFFTTDTAAEIAFGCENLGLPRAETRNRVAAAIDAFDLASLRDRSVFALSGGEKQRLACASVAATRPGLYVLDEPSANLDAAATRRLQRIMAAWKAAGATVIVAEHRLGYLRQLADRLVLLDHGRIVAEHSGDAFRAMDGAALRALGLRAADARYSPGPASPLAGQPVLELRDLHYRHRGRKVPGVGATSWSHDLRIDRLDLPTGRVTALTGPNGAGKTTLIRWLAGIAPARTGTLRQAGHVLGRRERRRRVFAVDQDVNHQLFTESALEEVALTLRLAGLRAGVEEEAARILGQVDLAELAERHPMALSAGQKQRLAIAAALASGRETVVLDEPTSGLDLAHMEQVADALRHLAGAGRTVVVATHDAELIEACADHTVALARGRLVGGQ